MQNTGGHWQPVPLEKQLQNLEKMRARKVGQLRAYEQVMFILGREIRKEEGELQIIEEDITSLSEEIEARF